MEAGEEYNNKKQGRKDCFFHRNDVLFRIRKEVKASGSDRRKSVWRPGRDNTSLVSGYKLCVSFV